jgi:hypothetical protein
MAAALRVDWHWGWCLRTLPGAKIVFVEGMDSAPDGIVMRRCDVC